MNTTDNKYFIAETTEALQSLRDKRYAEAISHLRAAAKIEPGIERDAEALEAQFFYMLRFLASDNAMPDIDTALADIASRLRVIARRIRIEDERLRGTSLYSGVLRYAALRPEETLESLFSDYIAELDRLSTDTAALTDTRRRGTLERLASDIFNRLWTVFPLSDEARTLTASMLSDEAMPLHDRELWVAALGLNFCTYPTDAVADLMLEVHAGDNARLSTLAAVWLVLGCDGNAFSERVKSAIDAAQPSDLADILLEWVRSIARTAIADSGKGDGMERLGRLGRGFMNRMRDIDPEKYEEKLTDPDWINSQLDSKDYEAIRRFAEAQTKGEDVFAGTLGKMRHFDFFNTLSNWFLPFHTAHSALAPVVDGEGAALADTVAAIPVLCDSDKYAMLLSMAQMPQGMSGDAMATLSQEMMSVTYSDEFEEMRKAAGEPSRRALINNEIKNIYRFFTLHRNRGEFADTLARPPHRGTLDTIASANPAAAAEIADMLFAAGRYAEAVRVYAALSEANPTVEQLHRYAYAAELAGMTDAAEDMYKDLIADNAADTWAALRLASLCEADGDAATLAGRLKPVAEANPDNVDVLRAYARTLALAGKWEEATEVYHNVNYLRPDDDTAAKSDLAWALAVTGDCDSAAALFESAGDDAPTLARKAAAQWLAGQHSAAVDTAAQAEAIDTRGDYLADRLYRAGCDSIAKSGSAEAHSLPMLYEIVRYRRYGSSFGTL